MKQILVLGAGLSSPTLIRYLLEHAEENKWFVRVGDFSEEIAQKRVNNHPQGEAFKFDVYDDEQRTREIRKANIVISMLPAKMHFLVAKTCIRFKRIWLQPRMFQKRLKHFMRRPGQMASFY